MAYGRKTIPPPATPFEEFMATASEKMIAAKLGFVEFLRELPPAAWIGIGVVIPCLRKPRRANSGKAPRSSNRAIGGGQSP